MTKDEVIDMARESGFLFDDYDGPIGFVYSMLKDFAELIAEKEREECAKICDEQAEGAYWEGADVCADAIRARGQE